jgi:preprotein translocase subunit SecE
MMGKLKKFLEESRAEFRHVNWPTREEAIRLTGVVIFLSVGLALFLGAFDYGFAAGLKAILLRKFQ